MCSDDNPCIFPDQRCHDGICISYKPGMQTVSVNSFDGKKDTIQGKGSVLHNDKQLQDEGIERAMINSYERSQRRLARRAATTNPRTNNRLRSMKMLQMQGNY